MRVVCDCIFGTVMTRVRTVAGSETTARGRKGADVRRRDLEKARPVTIGSMQTVPGSQKEWREFSDKQVKYPTPRDRREQ